MQASLVLRTMKSNRLVLNRSLIGGPFLGDV